MNTPDYPIYINAAGAICSLGQNIETIERNLFSARNSSDFLTMTDCYSSKHIPLGLVSTELPETKISSENTRNNRMLAASVNPLLNQINALKSRYGSHRIGVVVGTSTSGIAEGEEALYFDGTDIKLNPGYQYHSQEISAPSRFLAKWLELDGPCWSQSSACTSGAKALASASRLLKLNLCDAVIAAGVDTLCRMTVSGFSSLSVVSDSYCLPFSKNRNGINIGEGSSCFIMTREEGPVKLTGIGESSDAYHFSSPDPKGQGAADAMHNALKSAGLTPSDINYLNLHGTATKQNDSMEALAVNQVFGPDIACSSTKPLTGHTLAAAGSIEALFCWLLLQRSDTCLPPHVWDNEIDPDIKPLYGLARTESSRPAMTAMSNSFAFGGNNISLIMSRC